MTTQLTDAVQTKYAAVADSALSNDHAGVRAVAQAFGYTPEELQSIPAQANMGLSCGNPVALANPQPGEVVLDLGSGGGLDVFLTAAKVGPTGRAIGVDMTPAMVERARRAAQQGPDGKPYGNVEFHLATIDRLPLPDASVDCVISNCVINLAPDKAAVFREIARVLKPGGRLAASDIALRQTLPAELAQDVGAYVGCIAGAVFIDDYVRMLRTAGLSHVQVLDSGRDLNAYAKVENQSGCCSPVMDTAPHANAHVTATKATSAASSCCGGASTTQAPTPATTSSSCCGGSSARAPVALSVQVSSCGCSSKPSAATSTSAGGGQGAADLHQRLARLLERYNINDYAASVKVLAVKPA